VTNFISLLTCWSVTIGSRASLVREFVIEPSVDSVFRREL